MTTPALPTGLDTGASLGTPVRPRTAVSTAIIPLAGRATRLRPASLAIPKAFFPLVDRDQRAKPVIHFILDEAFGSGVTRACLVVGPGEEARYRAYFDALAAEGGSDWAAMAGRVTFAVQPEPLGFGHAVWCAREVAGGEAVLVMLGDHLYLTGEARRCARQLLDCFARYGASVSAVQRTGEAHLSQFGTIAAAPIPGDPRTFRVQRIVEKPPVELARRALRVPGLPHGEYLCWFGLHALTPGIFDVLAEDVAQRRLERGEYQLTGAQARLAQREVYYAHEVDGRRLDMGDPASLLAAQAGLREASGTTANGW